LGVALNYDSVFPLGQWQSQIVFSVHPINGLLSLATMGPESGYSVGASLNVDPLVARPVLEAADGFSDQGTPDAPMYAGLGDMAYNDNEPRGGHVLGAERALGRGVILAFGDTAFLQNSSVASNFAYIASIFEHLTRPARGTTPGAYYRIGLLFSLALIIGLVCQFSFPTALVSVALSLSAIWMQSTLTSDEEVIRRLNADLALVDDSHAELFRYHDTQKDLQTFLEILDRQFPALTLVSNAFEVIDDRSISTVILLSPQAGLSSSHQGRLTDFIRQGGALLYASGYPESVKHQAWLANLGCRISAMPLGAGQDVSVVDKRYRSVLKVMEAWNMELSSEWSHLLHCFGKPVAARRAFGAGRVVAIADGLAMLDGALSLGSTTNPDSYNFISSLLEDLRVDAAVLGPNEYSAND
jgi:hypothetical protein